MSAHRQFRSNPGTPVSSSGSTSSTPPRSSLSEIKAAARKAKRSSPRKSAPPVLILDPFAASMGSKNRVRGKTGFVFDEKMAEHFNPWDSEHIECPQRILRAKGQLISELLFSVIHFPKNNEKNMISFALESRNCFN